MNRLLPLLLLFVSCAVEGATWNAASANLVDVQTAYNSASNGDTVTVPAGIATWISTFTITKNITFQGAGAGITIITNGIAGPASRPPLLSINLVLNLPFRMTGFTFAGGTNPVRAFNGSIRVSGNCHLTRIDHCTFQNFNDTMIRFTGFLWGVVDHCTFNCIVSHPMFVEHQGWNGYQYGHGSWAAPANWGSGEFLFIENNTFNGGGGIDSLNGARFVVRYNTFVDCGLVGHGTEGQGRGMKQVEEYKNTYTFSALDQAGQFRSGSVVTFSNTWVNVGSGHVLQVYRPFDISPHFGPANGQNLWDKNVTNAVLGLGYWATGTHTGTNGSLNLVDANAGKVWYNNAGVVQVGAWATDRFFEAGYVYSVRNITQEPLPSNVRTYCVGNTANTVTCSTLRREASYTRVTFNNGDTYQIWKIQQPLDQPGMGQSDLLTGLGNWNTGVNLTTPYANPHQVQEPCYSWANSHDLASSQPNILEGRDFFNNTQKPGYAPYIYPHPLIGTNNPVQLAAALVFNQQPTTTATATTITPPITVRIVDTNGTIVVTNSTVTIAISANPGSGTLAGTLAVAAVNGVATFSNLSINNAGTGYTLLAASPGLTSATSSAFNIITPALPPSKIVFGQQPTTSQAASIITPAVTVIIQDSNSAVVSTNLTVTVAIGTNPGGGILSGTLTKAAVNGVATFDNLSINNGGTNYTLTAISSGLTGATSATFNVVSPALPPSKVVFGQQPTTTQTGAIITPSVTVLIQDSNGVLISTNLTVTVAIGTNPSGGALSGTLSQAAVNGVATFPNLSINNAGIGYTLTATSGALTGATSVAFNITAVPPAPPSKIVFGQQPSTTQADAFITPAVTALIQDASGNVISTNLTVIITVGTNPSGGTLSGTISTAAVNGVATFSGLSIDNAGAGYTLIAASSGLTSATSGAFNITAIPPAPPSKVVFGQQPTTTQVLADITPAVTILIQNASGNLVSTNLTVTVAIGTNPSAGILTGTLVVAAVDGVATFDDLKINKAGTGYTLTASCPGLTGATSSAFNITAPPATQLIIAQEPSTAPEDSIIAPAITVKICDANGAQTTSTANVTATIGTNPAGGTLAGTLIVAAVSGLAIFSNLSIDNAGLGYTLHFVSGALTATDSAAFNITVVPPPNPPHRPPSAPKGLSSILVTQ